MIVNAAAHNPSMLLKRLCLFRDFVKKFYRASKMPIRSAADEPFERPSWKSCPTSLPATAITLPMQKSL